MQDDQQPQETPRSVASAGYNHDADYLGYAGDFGYEGRVTADAQQHQDSGTPGAATAAEPGQTAESPAAPESVKTVVPRQSSRATPAVA